jgi:hypothetical protein
LVCIKSEIIIFIDKINIKKMESYLNLIRTVVEEVDNIDDIVRPVLTRQNAVYIESNIREVIKKYVKDEWGFETISVLLIIRIADFMRSYGYVPTKYQFIKSTIENCFCGIMFENHELAIQTGVYLLENLEREPECYYIQHTVNYYNQEHRYPTLEELSNYIGNINRMMSDPEGYYQETKHITPTPNLGSLLPKKCDKDGSNCGLCFDEIKKEEDCYTLPCNHLFHSEKEKCIDATVLDWLKNNRTCPICKQEVLID